MVKAAGRGICYGALGRIDAVMPGNTRGDEKSFLFDFGIHEVSVAVGTERGRQILIIDTAIFVRLLALSRRLM